MRSDSLDRFEKDTELIGKEQIVRFILEISWRDVAALTLYFFPRLPDFGG